MSGSKRSVRTDQMLSDEGRADARSLVQRCVVRAGTVERLGADLNMFSAQLRRVAEGKANAGQRLPRKVQDWAVENGVLP